MFRTLWDLFDRHFCAQRSFRDLGEIFDLVQWNSFDKMEEAAGVIAEKLRRAGADDVEVVNLPADGKTSYGGWYLPRAFDVRDARLEVIAPSIEPAVLFDYRSDPFALFLYSGSTPTREIDLVPVDRPESLSPGELSGQAALLPAADLSDCRAAFRAGAIGVVSDQIRTLGNIKTGEGLDDAVEWQNYALPLWAHEPKGFGISITPRNGRRLREILARGEKVRVRVTVDVRVYDGRLPVVTALRRGKTSDEMVVTGHFDEPGADDNTSGVAVCIELLRTLTQLQQAGDLPRLERGIRFIFGMEIRGLMGLLNTRDDAKRFVAGLNLDTAGSNQELHNGLLHMGKNFPILPSAVDDLVAELLMYAGDRHPRLRHGICQADLIDNIPGEPLVGAPTPQLYNITRHHHTSYDVPANIDPDMLKTLGVVTGTYTCFLANADLQEALYLADMVERHGIAEITAEAERQLSAPSSGPPTDPPEDHVRYTASKVERKLRDLVQWARKDDWQCRPEGFVTSHRIALGPDRLTPRESLLTTLDEAVERIRVVRDQQIARVHAALGHPSGLINSLAGKWEKRGAPLKTFIGFLAFETCSEQDQRYITDELGIPIGWGAPMWVQIALFAANGKRSLRDIAKFLSLEGVEADLERLGKMFDFFGEKGWIRYRPRLLRNDFLELFKALGLPSGETVLVHTSLSRYGYVEGGPETVLDSLLEHMGPEGTVMFPTFSNSWLGRRPFDPSRTPSYLGAIPNAALRRRDGIRSHHPTHSFAVFGKDNAEIVKGHDWRMAPIARESPIGKLVDRDGWVLMLAPLDTNTTMHAGEFWGGVPFVTNRARIVEGEKPVEVTLRDLPWLVRFDLAYEDLFRANKIRSETLGEEKSYLMKARDVVEAQMRVVREHPETLIGDDPECFYSRQIRERLIEPRGQP